jgi:hypothetical protein
MNPYARERVECIILRCKQRSELVGTEAKNELLKVAKDLEEFLSECDDRDTIPAPPLPSMPPDSKPGSLVSEP